MNGTVWDELIQAPPGFITEEEWKTFGSEGFLVLPSRPSPAELEAFQLAIDRIVGESPKFDLNETFKVGNLVARHKIFEELIDGCSHIGYVYDLFGEATKLFSSEVFLRPPHGYNSAWHVDGPTIAPCRDYVFRPVSVKVSYWPTDVSLPSRGNFIYYPGSQSIAESPGGARVPVCGEKVVTCQAGIITLSDARLWHRADRNLGDSTRKNIFLSYGLSWLNTPFPADLKWANNLPRNRRIIVRLYRDRPEMYSRPPVCDVPLFLRRDASRIPESVERLVYDNQRRMLPDDRWLPPDEFERLQDRWEAWFGDNRWQTTGIMKLPT